MRAVVVLALLLVPLSAHADDKLHVHTARAVARTPHRDPLARLVSHSPSKDALAYVGGCDMPRMPQVPDSRHAVTSDPRGVGGLVLGRLFVEGAVSGVALRPAESRGMQVTVGYVTWF